MRGSANLEKSWSAAGQISVLTLTISGPVITDDGLAHLKKVMGLTGLTIDGNPGVTDTGLIHLRGLTNLRWLTLYKTGVTDEGKAELRKHLPNCKIN